MLEKNAREEWKTVTGSWLNSLGKKRTPSCNIDVDGCDKFVVRNKQDSYMEERKVAAVPKSLFAIKEK